MDEMEKVTSHFEMFNEYSDYKHFLSKMGEKKPQSYKKKAFWPFHDLFALKSIA
jgi:hypothetical protein